MKKFILLALLACGLHSQAQTITDASVLPSASAGTGSSFFFDVTPNTIGLNITALDLYTQRIGAYGLTIYMKTGTYAGFEGTPAAWTAISTGTGIGTGFPNSSHVTLSAPLPLLLPGTTYGLVIVMDNTSDFMYSNIGSFKTISNADITLTSGAASNSPPFNGGTLSPRVWAGTLYYSPLPPTVPTLSQWGIVIFGLLMLSLGSVALFKQKQAAAL